MSEMRRRTFLQKSTLGAASVLGITSGTAEAAASKNEKINILLGQVDKIFKGTVVLKGGTALNKAYLQTTGVDRFSEDIDLDFIPPEKMNLNEKINFIKEKINEINGFEISAPRLLHRTLMFDISYVNGIDEKDLVRIEFYLSHDKALCKTPPQKQMLVSSFMSQSPVMFASYSFEDLLARKFTFPIPYSGFLWGAISDTERSFTIG